MPRDSTLNRRRFLKATGGTAGAAALAGCFGGGTDPDENESGNESEDGEDFDPDASEDNVFNLVNSTMSTLDPIASTDTASGRVIQQMFDGLMNYPNGEIEVEALLAEDYELSDDLLTYTFQLKDAEFHDGKQLTADDFVYSWRRLAESENSERRNFILEGTFLSVEHETEVVEDDEGEEVEQVVPDSLGVEAIDDSTLEVRLSSPNANALELMAYDSFSPIPEGIVGDIEGYDGEMDREEFATQNPIGTGPFQFETWEPDAEAEVTRFDNYHGDVADVDAVHWQILEDDDASYTYAMEGSADMFGIPTAQYDASLIDAEADDQGRQVGTYGPMENGEEAQYLGVPELNVYYVAFNVGSVPREVRQAIAYVTDHEELITEIFKERGEPAYTFTPPGIWPGGADAYESFIEDYPYGMNETDRDGAEAVLEEAGYTEDDPYELTLTTYESDVFQEFGRLTRDKLSGLGISLELDEAPFATLIERGMNGDLDFYSLGWTWSWPEADYGMFGFEPENTRTGESMQTGETTGYYLDWHTADSDAMRKAQEAWEQVEANPEPEEGKEAREEAYVEMEEAVWEDCVMIQLYHGLSERFYYDHVDIEPSGAMGGYMQKFNNVTLN